MVVTRPTWNRVAEGPLRLAPTAPISQRPKTFLTACRLAPDTSTSAPRLAHVLALPDLHAHDAGHGLHAQLLHRLAALLLRPALLAAGTALLAYGSTRGQHSTERA